MPDPHFCDSAAWCRREVVSHATHLKGPRAPVFQVLDESRIVVQEHPGDVIGFVVALRRGQNLLNLVVGALRSTGAAVYQFG